MSEDVDWAFCTPVRGDACRGWAIYVAGRFGGDVPSGSRPPDPHDLRDDMNLDAPFPRGGCAAGTGKRFTQQVCNVFAELVQIEIKGQATYVQVRCRILDTSCGGSYSRGRVVELHRHWEVSHCSHRACPEACLFPPSHC